MNHSISSGQSIANPNVKVNSFTARWNCLLKKENLETMRSKTGHGKLKNNPDIQTADSNMEHTLTTKEICNQREVELVYLIQFVAIGKINQV